MPATADHWRFVAKQRWQFQSNILSGLCLFAWLELLCKRADAIEWPAYWQRVAFLTLLSAFNSCLAVVEWAVHGRSISRVELNARPLFVLGHPRTGTTLLHTLLALDVETFGSCSTFCVGFPSSFLWFETFRGLFSSMVPPTRPMDDMPLSMDTPQEDELATNVLTAGMASPYMPLVFMSLEAEYRPFFSFEGATAARRRWVTAFLYFLRKLTLRARPGVRLVLKSPVHTSRVRLLLQLFPDAQFVYMHRQPLAVFQSAAHMAETTYWASYLATPTDASIQEFILSQFDRLFADYMQARDAIPLGNLVEVGYAELSADPAAAVRRVYFELGVSGFEERRVADRIHENLATCMPGYKANAFPPLPPRLLQAVAERWRPYAVEFGYAGEMDRAVADAEQLGGGGGYGAVQQVASQEGRGTGGAMRGE